MNSNWIGSVHFGTFEYYALLHTNHIFSGPTIPDAGEVSGEWKSKSRRRMAK